MGLTFMLLVTITPFMFFHLGKYLLTGVQSMLVMGMWFYFIETVFFTNPSAFSMTWMAFYGSLILAEVAWVQFIIHMVNQSKQYHANNHAKEILD